MSVTTGKLGIVRLCGDDMTRLRTAVFIRDKFTCQECGRKVIPHSMAANRAHLAHIVSRGAGGSDTSENTRTLCEACHLVGEHHPKSVRSKR